MRLFITIISSVFVCLAIVGCGNDRIQVPVTMPATKIDIQSQGVDRIAVGEIEVPSRQLSGAGGQLASELRSALVNLGRFEVLDRSALQSLMEEHQLNQSGLVDGQSAAELGRFQGAVALIRGNLRAYGAEQGPVQSRTQEYKDSENRIVRRRYQMRTAVARVEASLSLIDVQTGRTVAETPYSLSRNLQTQWLESTPPPIDADPILREMRQQIVNEFVRSIAPYRVTYEVALERDRNLPQLEQGNTAARIGEWSEAVVLYRQALATDPQSDKAMFNLGIALRSTGDFDGAVEMFRRAYMTNSRSKYENELRITREAASGAQQE